MRHRRYVYTSLIGFCICCVGSFLLLGCDSGDNTTAQPSGEAIQFVMNLPGPRTPTAAEWGSTIIKPSVSQPVVFLPELSVSADRCTIGIGGTQPGMVVDYGADGSTDGVIQLIENDSHTKLSSRVPVILPMGENTLKLRPGSEILLDRYCENPFTSSSMVEITGLALGFTSVATQSDGSPVWTLPTSVEVYVPLVDGHPTTAGAKVLLHWDPSVGSIPPVDQNGQKSCWGHAVFMRDGKTVLETTALRMINQKDAVISGSTSKIPFDTINVQFDLCQGHPVN